MLHSNWAVYLTEAQCGGTSKFWLTRRVEKRIITTTPAIFKSVCWLLLLNSEAIYASKKMHIAHAMWTRYWKEDTSCDFYSCLTITGCTAGRKARRSHRHTGMCLCYLSWVLEENPSVRTAISSCIFQRDIQAYMSLCPQEEAAAKQGRHAVQRKETGNSRISPGSRFASKKVHRDSFPQREVVLIICINKQLVSSGNHWRARISMGIL